MLPALAEAPVAAVGIDFYATSLDAVPQGYPKEILAGVIDARSSALESPEAWPASRKSSSLTSPRESR